MDLKKLSTDQIMFHAIDLFSRFSSTKIIEDKNRDTIINALFSFWISIFGIPSMLFTDNGGEFLNYDFIEMAEQLEIHVRTTAANAVKRQNLEWRQNLKRCQDIEYVQCTK